MALQYSGSHAGPPTVILKYLEQDASGNVWPVDRELLYYQKIYPKTEINKPDLYYAGFAEDGKTRVLIMEDLARNYFIPSHPYHWSADEFKSVLRTYARLHASGSRWLPPEDERDWMLQPQETRWDIDEILGMAEILVKAQKLDQDLDLYPLVEETRKFLSEFTAYPVTLLHYDAVPPNVALPFDQNQDAILIDWQDATWGMAQLDLAYLFNQPFSSARNIDRQSALDYYWELRQKISPDPESSTDKETIQRHADIIMCFTLIAVGQRAVNAPYPKGTYPFQHWESMFVILNKRLCELAAGK